MKTMEEWEFTHCLGNGKWELWQKLCVFAGMTGKVKWGQTMKNWNAMLEGWGRSEWEVRAFKKGHSMIFTFNLNPRISIRSSPVCLASGFYL